MYDIIIAGGGPSGSTAARRAAELGLNVICIEKAKMPRNKPCGGGIPEPAYPSLSFATNIFDSFSAGVTFSASDGTVVTRTDLTAGAFVLRADFDHMLFQDARRAGATTVEGERILDLKVLDSEVCVTTSKSKYSGKMVFGADGVNSVIAKQSGLKKKWLPNEVAQVYVNETEIGEKKMDEIYTPHRMTYFHFGFNQKMGYGWIFPKKKHVNVGYGGVLSQRDNRKVAFLDYVKKRQAEGILPEINHKNTTAALIPICGPLKHVVSKRVFLLGDAAGFVNPINGEGIHYAILSGMIAAETALPIIQQNDFRIKSLQKYQKRCIKEFGRNLTWFRRLQNFGFNRLSQLLLYSQHDLEFGRLFLGLLLSWNFEHKWALLPKYLKLKIKQIFGKL